MSALFKWIAVTYGRILLNWWVSPANWRRARRGTEPPPICNGNGVGNGGTVSSLTRAAGSFTRITLGRNDATGRGAPGRKNERLSSMYLKTCQLNHVKSSACTSDRKRASEERRRRRTCGPAQRVRSRTTVY